MSTQDQPEAASSEYITRKETGQPISQTVLEAVAELSSRAVIPDVSLPRDDESRSLTPLYEAIDPDALNTISQSATDETEITVTFTYCGYDVTIKNGDEVLVCEK